MRLAWLLLLRSGKNNWNRLGLTAVAVALGILMLLVFTAGINGLINRSSEHSQWRYDIFASDENGVAKPIEGVKPLKANVATNGNLNKWQNTNITTVSLCATDDTSPQLVGLPTPKEGEYYASQGLNEILRNHPEDAIGQRFGTKQIGIIPEALSTSPDALEVIRGMSEQEARSERTVNVYRFTTKKASLFSGDVGMILVVGASILLLPIVTFISIATQLGSAQREKRYAAMRLVGATRRQISRIIAVESLSAALVGIAIGSLAFLAILPLLSRYKLDGMRFWPDDLEVSFGYYVLVVIMTLLLCWFANWRGMRSVQLSPLGVARSTKTGKRPRVWRLVLLLPGILMFAWMTTPGGRQWLRDNSTGDNATLVMGLLAMGIMSIMFGLLLAGPWLTSSISRLMARRTRRVTTLLAGKRIATQSKRVFRSVSGVVLALFAGSFYLTSVSGIAQYSARAVTNNGYSQLQNDTAVVMSDVLPAGFHDALQKRPYVQSAAAIAMAGNKGNLIDCQTLSIYTRLACPNGAAPYDKALLNFDSPAVKSVAVVKDVPSATSTSYLVRLDSNDHLDQLRSFVAEHAGIDTPTYVVSGTYAQIPVINPFIPELASLAYAGMAITLFVAIASLIVSTIGGLLERKRSFATLRLGGMTVGQMKRTIMVESLIPLISVSLVACGLGIWVGMVFISALSESMNPTLTPLYFCIVAGSLVIGSLAIRAVVPMLDKLTRPEENQTE